MEENLRLVELVGGKHAKLEFVTDDDTSYIIRAYDDENNVVGSCYFDIEKLFQRHLSDDERIAVSSYFGGLEKTPTTSEVYVTKKDLPRYEIDGRVLSCKTHGVMQKFPLKFAKCHLESIEIKSEEFFKTGLGFAMLGVMEKFARANDCFQIYATFCPFGKFASGSRKFYERNGFSIEYDPCDHKQYATKPLPQKEISKTNSDGGKA